MQKMVRSLARTTCGVFRLLLMCLLSRLKKDVFRQRFLPLAIMMATMIAAMRDQISSMSVETPKFAADLTMQLGPRLLHNVMQMRT